MYNEIEKDNLYSTSFILINTLYVFLFFLEFIEINTVQL